MRQTSLFWAAIVLIIEPVIAIAWPRIRASLLLSYPYKDGQASRISNYYGSLDRPFGIMCPFRIKARRWMQTIGVMILIILLASHLYENIAIPLR